MADNQRNIEENNSWDHLSKWETLVDERIRAWLGDGNMSDHPKAGQPLELNEDQHTPEELRLAHKIMKDNDAVPPWMALGFTLRDKHAKIHKRVKAYARDYARRQQYAVEAGSFILHREADERWQKAIRQLKVDIGNYNSELMTYNLQVPASIGQMIPINASELIENARLQAQKRND